LAPFNIRWSGTYVWFTYAEDKELICYSALLLKEIR
jgi:hypothetical protein